MAEKIFMIALSPTMENGVLARWKKAEGDVIKQGDIICEVETDKATMEYESSVEGTLLKILLQEGGKASIGDVIAIAGKPDEDISNLLVTNKKDKIITSTKEKQPEVNAPLDAIVFESKDAKPDRKSVV